MKCSKIISRLGNLFSFWFTLKGEDRSHIHGPGEGFLHIVEAGGYSYERIQGHLLLTHRGIVALSGQAFI